MTNGILELTIFALAQRASQVWLACGRAGLSEVTTCQKSHAFSPAFCYQRLKKFTDDFLRLTKEKDYK